MTSSTEGNNSENKILRLFSFDDNGNKVELQDANLIPEKSSDSDSFNMEELDSSLEESPPRPSEQSGMSRLVKKFSHLLDVDEDSETEDFPQKKLPFKDYLAASPQNADK